MRPLRFERRLNRPLGLLLFTSFVAFVDKIGERRISTVPRVCVHVRRRSVWHRKKSGFIYFFYARAATQSKKGKENLIIVADSWRTDHEPDNISDCNAFKFEVFSGDGQLFFISY